MSYRITVLNANRDIQHVINVSTIAEVNELLNFDISPDSSRPISNNIRVYGFYETCPDNGLTWRVTRH